MGEVVYLQEYRDRRNKLTRLRDVVSYLDQWRTGGGDILSVLYDTLQAFITTGSHEHDDALGVTIVPDKARGCIEAVFSSALGQSPLMDFIRLHYLHHAAETAPSDVLDATATLTTLIDLLETEPSMGDYHWPYARLIQCLLQTLGNCRWVARRAARPGFGQFRLEMIHLTTGKALTIHINLDAGYRDTAYLDLHERKGE